MGGGGGPTTQTTQSTSTAVTVTNNITGPPVTVNVGSEVLQPIAQTFEPAVAGLQTSLKALAVGFQDAEVRRQHQEDRSAALVQQNAQMMKMVLYGLLGFAAFQLVKR